MKEKGFTLIELLAVIVILAIIALIATPIILNIINDSKVESKKRSAENYFDAVELAVANKNLEGKFNPSKCTIEEKTKELICEGEFDTVHCGGEVCTAAELNVKVDGEVPTEATIEFSNGTVANGTTIKIGGTSFVKESSGLEVQSSKSEPEQNIKRYYSSSNGTIGGEKPTDAIENEPDKYLIYNTSVLGFDVDSNNKVIAAYTCFSFNEKIHCLKGGEKTFYETNVTIMQEVYKNQLELCSFGVDSYWCGNSGFFVTASSDGSVRAGSQYENCSVKSNGSFECAH